MKNRAKLLTIVILGIIIISNSPPVYYFIGEQYNYQNKDGSFSFTEQPGTIQNFDLAIVRFKKFNKKHSHKNKTLYRTFTFEPWKFWEWYNLLTNLKRFHIAKLD